MTIKELIDILSVFPPDWTVDLADLKGLYWVMEPSNVVDEGDQVVITTEGINISPP